MGRSPRPASTGPAWSDDDDPRARLSAALLPILRARDVAGFLRVVEEAWGDASQFSEMSEEGLRLIMAGMLSSPRDYGLPRWPAAAAPIAEPPPAPDSAPADRPDPATEDGGPAPAASAAPPQPPADPPPSEGQAPAAAAFNLALPGFGPAGPTPRRTSRRRPPRRPSDGGEQLALF